MNKLVEHESKITLEIYREELEKETNQNQILQDKIDNFSQSSLIQRLCMAFKGKLK